MIFIEIPENINNRRDIKVYTAKSIDEATEKDRLEPEKIYQFPKEYVAAGAKVKKQDITITQAGRICVQVGSRLWCG
jgi:predicted nucleotide-binding protein (sugar kinase/HSP70/actin superfamily)